jgi:FkbM family methyltransferase
LRRFPPLYKGVLWLNVQTIERARGSRRFLRSRIYKKLDYMANLAKTYNFRGGLLTEEGMFYLRMPGDIYVFYNFSNSDLTLGDGQSLDFVSSKNHDPVAQILFAILDEGSTYVDVGANNGYYYTLQVAKHFPASTVFAFEPNPKILHHLQMNVQFNQLDNVHVLPKALSDYIGKASLTLDLGANSFLTFRKNPVFEIYEVDCFTLDHFVSDRGIRKMDLVKVDIEGGEMKFLNGARKTIETMAPKIILELKQHLLERSGSDEEEVVSFLTEMGYEVHRIKGTGDALCLPMGDLQAWKDIEEKGLNNLLARF